MLSAMRHRDEMSDQEMATEIDVPVALVAWARKKDPSIEPPPLQEGYDLALQQGIVDQVRRASSAWAVFDRWKPE
jgi:hypothetical protein